MKIKQKLITIISNNKTGILLLSLIASVINYGFQIYVGRQLSVEAYGSFNYEIAFVSNCYSFFAPLSVLVCRITSEHGRVLKANRLIYRQVLVTSIIVSVVMLLIIPVYRVYLQNRGLLKGDVGIGLIEIITLCTCFSMLLMGLVQGLARFWEYGIFNVLLMVSKFIIMLFLRKDVSGAILSYIYSDLLIIMMICIYLLWIAKSEPDDSDAFDKIPTKSITKLYGGVFVVQLLNLLYINSGEMIIMRYTFHDDILGVYSVASQLCRMGVYITSIVSTILLPEIAYKDNKKNERLLGLLNRSYLASIAIVAMYSMGLILFRKILVINLYGEKYLYASELIIKMLPFAIGISLIPIINSFFLGINRLHIVILLYVMGVFAALFGTITLKLGITYIVVLYGVVVLIIDVAGYIAGYFYCRQSKEMLTNE